MGPVPIVGQLLEIWDATGRYVDAYVDQAYQTDPDVQGDHELHDWMQASGSADGGNLRGLPAMDSTCATRPCSSCVASSSASSSASSRTRPLAVARNIET